MLKKKRLNKLQRAAEAAATAAANAAERAAAIVRVPAAARSLIEFGPMDGEWSHSSDQMNSSSSGSHRNWYNAGEMEPLIPPNSDSGSESLESIPEIEIDVDGYPCTICGVFYLTEHEARTCTQECERRN